MVGAEIGVRNHCYHRRAVEEPYGMRAQQRQVYHSLGAWVTVYERIGQEQRALLCVYKVHCTEMVELWIDSNYFLCHIGSVPVLARQACYQSVGVAGFHHHHAEIIALIHLVVSLLERAAFALFFSGKYGRIPFAALHLVVVAQV